MHVILTFMNLPVPGVGYSTPVSDPNHLFEPPWEMSLFSKES